MVEATHLTCNSQRRLELSIKLIFVLGVFSAGNYNEIKLKRMAVNYIVSFTFFYLFAIQGKYRVNFSVYKSCICNCIISDHRLRL